MTERLRSASTTGPPGPKMESDLGPRKTLLVLVIVVGCFAVLWPKVFYPMLVGSANQHMKPSPIDKATGCCDVISETDVNTIKIMSELCGTIIKATEDGPLTGKELVRRCHREVLDTCGIDISLVLQEQVRLGQNVKQILDEVRSLNGSLCLKYNYGVAPWRLGVPHRAKVAPESPNIRQERPMHLRSELVHPAFRERGRAIPQPQQAPPTRPPPRIVEGRPGPVPGMRPTIGGAGHMVPPSKQGPSNISVFMPIYTIVIVIFFSYTLIKIVFKKPAEHVGGSLYPQIDPDPHFRKEVFESEASRLGPRLTRENIASKLVVNAMSALLDEVDQEMEARRKSNELASQDLANGTLSNGSAVKPQDEEQPTVKVLGMEMTASCEGGKKWSRPESPVLPPSPSPPPAEPSPPPQEIFLEGALPAQSHLLVADSATEPQPSSGEDPAVVLSGKMTLSVISLDSENGEEATNATEEASKSAIDEKPIVELEDSREPATSIQESTIRLVEELLKEQDLPVVEEKPTFDIEDETDRLLANLNDETLDKDIEAFLQKLKQQDFQAPSITLESDDIPHTVEMESLEKEVDQMILEAIESVQQKDVKPTPDEPTNDIKNDLKPFELEETLPKLELKEEISSEIEKLIQEVKDLPVIQPTQGGHLEEAQGTVSITEAGDGPIKEKLNKEAEKLEAAVDEISHKMDELTSSIEDVGTVVSKEFEELGTKKDSEVPVEAAALNVEETPKIEETVVEETKKIEEAVVEASAPKVEETQNVEKPAGVVETTPPKVEERQKIEEAAVEIAPAKVEETKKIEEAVVEASAPKVEETQKVDEPAGAVEITPPKVEDRQKIEEAPVEIAPTKVEETKKIEEAVVEASAAKVEKTQKVEESPGLVEIAQAEVEETQKMGEAAGVVEIAPAKIEETQKIDEAVVETSAPKVEEIQKVQELAGVVEIAPAKVEETQKIEGAVVETAPAKVEEKQNIEAAVEKREAVAASVAPDLVSSIEAAPAREAQKTEVVEAKIEKSDARVEERQKVDEVEEKVEKTEAKDLMAAKPSTPTETPKAEQDLLLSKTEESKSKTSEFGDEEELGSDEELVEEIEEVEYEEESEEEEIEIEEESEEELLDDRNANRTESSSVQKVNGERSEDFVEESKYTTVSGATAAENDISDEELIDHEEVEDDEEIIEIEEELDEDYANEDLNNISGESEEEL